MKRARPSRAELEAAYGRSVPDVIAPGLRVVFVGINPSLYSAAVGHHFARPGNRFWPALHDGGFTERLLSPDEEQALLGRGLGVTNIVDRATARADELSADEIRAGAKDLRHKLCRYRPRIAAFLGLTAFRLAFGSTGAEVGPQDDRVCSTRVWLLPNPSGLNAHYQRPDFARLFAELRRASQCPTARR